MAALALASLLLATALSEEQQGTRAHLVARLPEVPPPPGKAPWRQAGSVPIARISSLYEVDSQNWASMLLAMENQTAAALSNLSSDYVETFSWEPHLVGKRCERNVIRCSTNSAGDGAVLAPGWGGMGGDADLEETDPNFCERVVDDGPEHYEQTTPKAFLPAEGSSNEELQELAASTPLCVSPYNTSLQVSYWTFVENVFITGVRDKLNGNVTNSSVEGIPMELHVIGRLNVSVALFLNAKFLLNESLPNVSYEDSQGWDNSTNLTVFLNGSTIVWGLRGSEEDVPRLPVCVAPPLRMLGCVRVDHTVFSHKNLSEYKLNSYVRWQKHFYVRYASAQPWREGGWNVSEGPWPQLKWLGPADAGAPWHHRSFPQKESVYQEGCISGVACENLPMGPPLRHQHSAVLYKSWNFKDHARRYLCNDRPECGPDCLANLTCLGGSSYYDQSFFFRSRQFRADDGGVVPVMGITDIDCPGLCCSDRRSCMRKTDVMGYPVPFDREFMLVFGGMSYRHEKDALGRLVYHHCEEIPSVDLLTSWRSCTELALADLWRYDLKLGSWHYIKPDSAISPATLLPVGFPVARFAHAAVLVEDADGRDPFSKRLYMYLFGGLGPTCQGVCNDLWRYEVPWAAQAYFPKFPDLEWQRGNVWDRLRDCPFGGLYRHKMVATSGQEYIYTFGGQVLGGFRHSLYRYRIATDLWEDLAPLGRVSLTRLMYDYSGAVRFRQVHTSEYEPKMDLDCGKAPNFRGPWSHCQICPACGLQSAHRGENDRADLPEERGDFAMISFPNTSPDAIDDHIMIMGGYRSTWGAQSDFKCPTTTTTWNLPMRSMGDVVWPGGAQAASSSTSGVASTSTVTTTVRSRSGAAQAVLDGPGSCTAQYYFDDLWSYDSNENQWVRQNTLGALPLSRKGHSLLALRAGGNDTQLLLFGGHHQDLAMSDLWVLDVMRSGSERSWTRIDPFLHGQHPPTMTGHSAVWSEDQKAMFAFGGLHWTLTNLTESDRMRNTDRRCFKEALGLAEQEQGTAEDVFYNRMRSLCESMAFCCVLTQSSNSTGIPDFVGDAPTRNSTGGLDLVAIGSICRKDCEARQFAPDFQPTMVEGIWTFRTQNCLNGCNDRGRCELSSCICEPPWYGRDCSLRRCPGSSCYTDPRTKEQHCVECSQHGLCVRGQCVCSPGWGYEDCSAVLCEANCSSTPMETRGICVEDFPVNQCHCFGHWSGPNCSTLLCLNSCSGRGSCVQGRCECSRGYHGADCSVFFGGVDELELWRREL